MGKEYKIADVEVRNEWSFQGQVMQDYAILLQGVDGWVKITQKSATPPPKVGATLFGIIEDKQMPNGTSYKKFKKDAQGFGGPPPRDNAQMNYIVQMLEELIDWKRSTGPVDESEPDPFGGRL